MPRFINSLRDWGLDSFSKTLKHEIEALRAGVLPLKKGTSQGGLVDDSNITATVMSFSDAKNSIDAKVGIFFTEIIGGCSCGDEPVSENAYCELQFSIDKTTAETEIDIIPD